MSGALLAALGRTTLSASVMILALAALRARFGGEAPRRVFCLLWDIVLIRLLVPVEIASPWSVRALLGDRSQEALEVCRRNIRQCALAERVEAVRLDALAPPPASIGAFHCVTCNPPYISRAELETLDRSVRDYEPRLALLGGEDGYAFYRAVTRQWKGILRPGGRLYFEVGMGQAETVRRMMEAEGFRDVQALPDSRDIPRLVYGTWT